MLGPCFEGCQLNGPSRPRQRKRRQAGRVLLLALFSGMAINPIKSPLNLDNPPKSHQDPINSKQNPMKSTSTSHHQSPPKSHDFSGGNPARRSTLSRCQGKGGRIALRRGGAALQD